MLLPFFRRLFGVTPAPPPIADALASLDALTETLTAGERHELCALAGDEAAAIGRYLRLLRAAAIVHLLKFRGPQDHAIAELYMPFYRRWFDAEAPDAPVLPGEHMLERAEEMILAAPGRTAAERLAQGDPCARELLAKARDLSLVFNAVSDFLAHNYGALTRATRENYDEDAYLAANPDVLDSVTRGEIRSGRAHFLAHGEAEGRSLRFFRRDDGLCRAVAYPLTFHRSAHTTFWGGEPEQCAETTLDALLAAPPGAGVSLAIAEPALQMDAAPSFDADLCVGTELPDFIHLAAHTAWRAGALYLTSFRDGLADVENGLVLYDGARVWSDSAHATLLYVGGLTRAPDMFLLDGRYGRLETTRPDVIEGPAMLATSWATRGNYGHWMMNALFSAWLARDALAEGRLKLLTSRLTPRLREELLRLGAPPEAIVECSSRYARCDHLIYPSPLSTSGNAFPHPAMRDFLRDLGERFPPAPDLPRPRLVYLTRQGFPSVRQMTNEAELAAALAALGFVCVATHEMRFEDQIHILSQARVVIGQFGAAMWNAAFMPPGGRLVEIVTTNYYSNEYMFVAHLIDARFSRVMVEPDLVDPDNPQSCAFRAPIEDIVALARRMI